MSRDEVQGHVDVGHDGAGSHGGESLSAHRREVLETPPLPAEVQMGVPGGVVHHVGEDVEPGGRQGAFLEFERGVLQRFDQVGVRHRVFAGRGGQGIDTGHERVAACAEASGRIAHGQRRLRRDVVAVARTVALILRQVDLQVRVSRTACTRGPGIRAVPPTFGRRRTRAVPCRGSALRPRSCSNAPGSSRWVGMSNGLLRSTRNVAPTAMSPPGPQRSSSRAGSGSDTGIEDQGERNHGTDRG